MTIGGTLASALSGLTAASKRAELVASNIANAATPGYGRRELQVTSRVVGTSGQGVQIVGVSRAVDQALVNDRRLAQAELGNADARAEFYKKIEALMGTPDQAGSLNGRVAAFESALTEALSHPESEPRLNAVVSTAKGVASSITAIGKDIQNARAQADNEIASLVKQLNDGLERATKLNVQIRKGYGLGQDVTALQDQRQQVIDQISQIVPLREVLQTDGTVSLYTTAGGVLLDGIPSVFGFTESSPITPETTLQSGALGGLTLNGRATPTSGNSSVITGGSLAANFAIRDDLAVEAQAQIDAVARDLIERYQDSGLDATRASGDPGLFTDHGLVFDSANEVGLAQRIKVNALVDPDQGGALWRLRDGLGATTPGVVGNTALLTDLRAVLTAQRSPASGGFMAGERSFSVLASDLLSITASAKLSTQGEATYANTRLETFTSLEAEGGVDTDQEMQDLLQIEQSYAANAKVIKAVDEMIHTLMDL